MTVTDLRTCRHCGVRITFLRTPEGKGMPPVNWAADPLGTIAASQLATGAWVGRFLARGEEPVPPEKRYAQHWCAGRERQTRHSGRTAVQRPRGRQPGQLRLRPEENR